MCNCGLPEYLQRCFDIFVVVLGTPFLWKSLLFLGAVKCGCLEREFTKKNNQGKQSILSPKGREDDKNSAERNDKRATRTGNLSFSALDVVLFGWVCSVLLSLRYQNLCRPAAFGWTEQSRSDGEPPYSVRGDWAPAGTPHTQINLYIYKPGGKKGRRWLQVR